MGHYSEAHITAITKKLNSNNLDGKIAEMRIVKAQLQNNYTSVIFDSAKDWIMKTVTTHNIAMHQINVIRKKNIILSYKDH